MRLYIYVLIFFLICLTLTSISYLLLKIIKNKDNFNSIYDTKFDNFSENSFYFEIDDVLNNKECDNLIKDAHTQLTRSTIMSSNREKDGDISDARTSHHAWLNNLTHKNIIEKVENIVNSFLTNKINSGQFESIQVARYKSNQEYKEHYDICHPEQAYPKHIKRCEEDYKKFKNVRYITVILYLNDNFNNGETYFPLLNKKITPKKGKALIFFNCNLNKNTHINGLGDTIKNSLHAGLPVKNNEKWIANIWIRTTQL